ncbi:hypothetical protein F0U60_45090 [Archangium minus]|uniref:Lipoprotein n=1 Tax=Archangium minus TaxID=83450 RepID=A0ABY9X5C1_9BACT|nr:hypothetical protein F0U60_45090 [Archangium minus]
MSIQLERLKVHGVRSLRDVVLWLRPLDVILDPQVGKAMHCLTLILLLLSPVAFASGPELSLEADTRLGKLRIKDLELDEEEGPGVVRVVLLNGEEIHRREHTHLEIVKVFHVKDDEVVLLSENPGGAGTNDSHFFIQLRKGAAPVVSKTFDSQKGEVSTKQNGDSIEVDLGYHEGKRQVLVYQNGKQTLREISPKGKQAADEGDCKHLYGDVYEAFVREGHCDLAPEDVGGMSTVRVYNELGHDPRLDLKSLDDLARRSCEERKAMKYSEFRKKVCGG